MIDNITSKVSESFIRRESSSINGGLDFSISCYVLSMEDMKKLLEEHSEEVLSITRPKWVYGETNES